MKPKGKAPAAREAWDLGRCRPSEVTQTYAGQGTSGVLGDTAMFFACSTAMFLLLLGAWPGNTGELGVLENFLGNNCKVLPLGVSQLLKAREL